MPTMGKEEIYFFQLNLMNWGSKEPEGCGNNSTSSAENYG